MPNARVGFSPKICLPSKKSCCSHCFQWENNRWQLMFFLEALWIEDETGQVFDETPSRFCSGWWLNQPIWNIWTSKWESSPNRGENKKYLKPPPSVPLLIKDLSLSLPSLLLHENTCSIVCFLVSNVLNMVGQKNRFHQNWLTIIVERFRKLKPSLNKSKYPAAIAIESPYCSWHKCHQTADFPWLC